MTNKSLVGTYSTSSRNIIPALTGLRGLAAWWIVSFHFREFFYLTPAWLIHFFAKGYLAVDLFFILSGFSIYLSAEPLAERPTLKQFWLFIRRRLYRIYPVHFFMLIAYILLAIGFVIYSKSRSVPEIFSFDSLLANLVLVQNWGFVDHLSWNVPAWAISSLFAAYLLFPFIGYVAYKLKDNHVLIIILTVTVALSMGGLFWALGAISIGDQIPRLGTVRCILEFALGCFLGVIYLYFGDRVRQHYWFVGALSIIAIIAYNVYDISDFWIFPIAFSLLILFLCFDAGPIARLCEHRFVVFLGVISYSTYMVHMFVREVFRAVFVSDKLTSEIAALALGCIVVVFIASLGLYYALERPALRWFGAMLKD